MRPCATRLQVKREVVRVNLARLVLERDRSASARERSSRKYNEGWRWSSSRIRERLRQISPSTKYRSRRRRPSSAIRWVESWLIRVIQPSRSGWYCWAFLKSGVYWQSCIPSVARLFASSAPDGPRAPREEIMKKSISKGVIADRVAADEILPEYDFKRGSPNKFASRYAAGSTVVVLEPDVAAVFSSSEEVNKALRALAGIVQKRLHGRRTTSRRSH